MYDVFGLKNRQFKAAKRVNRWVYTSFLFLVVPLYILYVRKLDCNVLYAFSESGTTLPEGSITRHIC